MVFIENPVRRHVDHIVGAGIAPKVILAGPRLPIGDWQPVHTAPPIDPPRSPTRPIPGRIAKSRQRRIRAPGHARRFAQRRYHR